MAREPGGTPDEAVSNGVRQTGLTEAKMPLHHASPSPSTGSEGWERKSEMTGNAGGIRTGMKGKGGASREE